MEKYDIFVSYRRDGGEALACLISERLRQRGFSVFYDVESLRSGKFNEKIFQVIENCTDVVVVLPKGGLDRCKNEDDWVRKEISYAIGAKKNIIPVMMRGFEFPSVLPEDIDDIRNYQGVSANMEYFEASFEKLMSMLKSANSISIDRVMQLTENKVLQAEFAKCVEDVKNLNSAESKYNLARCYKKIHNSNYNEEMAKLYLQAAKAGHAEAQNALGYCYEKGTGVGLNIEKAIDWYKASADQGCVSAQVHLGRCYRKNATSLYLTYLKRAAEQNHKDALYELGNYYREQEDFKSAKEYFEKAAELGNEDAQREISGKLRKLYWWFHMHKGILGTIAGAVAIILFLIGIIVLIVLEANGLLPEGGV